MLKFYYNPAYKYTNRSIIDLSKDTNFTEEDYENIDSPDTINGHLIYEIEDGPIVMPTYIVEEDTELGISRRYYVSGITQLNTFKYQISVIRDIISENPELWSIEESYILAGTAPDGNYNKYKRWDLPFTNTKIKEERLDINGKSSFFVFYVNTQSTSENILTEEDLKIEYVDVEGITKFDFTVASFDEIPSFNLVNAGKLTRWTNASAVIRARCDTGNGIFGASQLREYPLQYTRNSSGTSSLSIPSAVNSNKNNIMLKTNISNIINNVNNCKNDLLYAIDTFHKNYENIIAPVQITEEQITNLEPYVDKVIYNSTEQKVYRIKLLLTGESNQRTILKEETEELKAAMRNINFPQLTNTNIEFLTETGYWWYGFNSSRQLYTYTLEDLGSVTSFNFNFISKQRKLPKTAVRCVNIVSNNIHSDDSIAQSLMLAQTNALNLNEDTGRILDIQFLPFSIATENNENLLINNEPCVAQFLDFDDWEYNTELPQLTNVNKETDSIIITSPSRASQFMYRQYNNDGLLNFNIQITLRPFNSRIYIRPTTQGLLLEDYNDKNCLIIEEDFSLTNVNSDWANYVYNNKNYQNTFNREIQTKEFERDWERQVETAQAKSDNWTSRNISAQKASTYTGNIPILSGISSAIGTAWKDTQYLAAAQLDREYNEALYQESISLSQDLFSMQIDNIKAQPLIPSKITNQDIKLLDGIYLEYYSTNNTEINAINSFYRYNGNRIDDYGTFKEYWGTYVKGEIIRSVNYTQPEVTELNRRLNNGIFTEVIENGN